MPIANKKDLVEKPSPTRNTDRMLTKILQKLHRRSPSHEQNAEKESPIPNEEEDPLSEPNVSEQVKSIFYYYSILLLSICSCEVKQYVVSFSFSF